MTERMYRVGDLYTMVPLRFEADTHLVPSNYTPPERHELPEPEPAFPAEALVELFVDASKEGSWEDPATLEARNGMLIARHVPSSI